MQPCFELKDRSDQQLLAGAKALAGREREATAQLIAHLAEIDERRLYLGEGCSSLFKYCIEVLHLSESAAYHRIDVARLARKFPVVLEKLAAGSIHLRALRILGPCMTEQNHLTLLEAAKHRNKEEVERIAVTIRPRPDVASVVRKLPERMGSEPKAAPLFESGSNMTLAVSGNNSEIPHTSPAPTLPPPPRVPVVSALSRGRYKVEFTADEETEKALRELQELLRHRIPNGDPALIFKKALLLLLEEVHREKFGHTKHPRKTKSGEVDLWQADGAKDKVEVEVLDETESPDNSGMASRSATEPRESRHIPVEVKRSVWKRDGGRCAFVSRNGRRCTERGRLEFHHLHAYALGGLATIENIALRCRAHNAHESRVVFGKNASQKRNRKKLSRSGASSRARSQAGEIDGKQTGP